MYRAAPGEANTITMTVDDKDVIITDTGAAALPASLAGCVPEAVAAGFSVRCRAPGQIVVRIDLSDGDNTLTAWELTHRVSLDVTHG